MTSKKPVLIVLAVLLLAGLFATSNVQRAHALSQGVSLDAASTSQTDVIRAATASNAHGFRIGAIVTNASATNPISTVYGWQFTIGYNASAFIPQGDPNAGGLYPDGAFNTVLFGAQITTGTVNWAGLISAQQAFGGSSISAAGNNGQISVFITLISPAPAVTISAPTLLANVAFELLPGHQPGAYTFTISNVIFVNSAGAGITGPIPGLGVTETVTDEPPVARMSFTNLPANDPSCVPVTGVNCTAYAYSFDGSASTDSDGTITSPTGYFWDFGDGVQDLGATGVTIIHDYGAVAVVPGKFNVTLRVVDNSGNTASARDGLGNVILNNQPSHTQILNLSVDQVPTASFTATPSSGSPPLTVNFDGTASTDPDGTVAKYFWKFGDSSPVQTTTTATTSHVYGSLGSFTASLIVQDNTGGNSTNTVTQTITVSQAAQPPVVTVNSPTPNPVNTGATVTVTFSVSSTTTVTGITVNWGDGTTIDNLPGTATSDTHVYANTGAAKSQIFTITVTATNSAGPGQGTTAETINDRSPAVAAPNVSPNPANTGQTVTATFTATDPDGTVSSISVNWGDGTAADSLPGTATSDTHSYVSAGSFTITITATDNSGNTGQNTGSVTIQAVAVPTVTVNSPTPNPANTGATVTVTFTVTSSVTVTGISVNWGDGTAADSLAGTATSDTHVYANTGSAKSQVFTITVTATNSAGPGSGTTTETVNDRPPVVTISTVSPNPADTGATVTVTFTATDPDGTIASISVNWGDGTALDSLAGTATSDTHIYANTGSAKSQVFTITVTATDNSGSTGSATTSETVNDRPPVVTVTNVSPNPVNTGQLVTITFTATDPDGTVSSITVNWGDSSPLDNLAGTATSDTHTYNSAGSFTITVTATDNSGSTGQGTGSITVNAIGVPTVTVNSPTPNPANTGQTVTVTFTVSSTVTVTGITVNWGDGTTADNLAGTATSDTHVYASTGNLKSQTFTITVTATNSAGPGSATTTEVVNDLPPTVTISTILPNPADTGQMVTVTFSATDPDGTVASISVNWGDGSPVDTLAGSATSDTHSYSSTGSATTQAFMITVTATDNSGSTGSATTSETVNDRPPVVSVTNVSPNPANTGQLVTTTFTATDPDGTISSITVNWGDGTAPDTLAGTATSDTHTYAAAGSFTITVTATDNSGSTGQGTGSITVNVVVGVPTVTVNSPTPNPADTGATVTVTFTVTSTATVTGISVNWGDGTAADSLAGTATSDTHVYTSTISTSQSFTITVTATNSAGPGSGTTTEVVNDMPPVVTITSITPPSPFVGQSVTVSFTATDPDGTVSSISVNWGDGTALDSLPGTATSDTHVYSVGGTFTMIITATDNSGSTGQASSSITTALVGVPTVTVNSPTPNPATTGQTVTVTFTVSSTATVTGISVDWGDGTTPDSLAGTATSDTHTYASTGNAKSQIFTIVVTATNSAGPGSGTTTETVNDQPPTVSIISILPNPVNTGSLATVTFTTNDPDGTVSSISVDWGDSTTADTLPGTATSDTHAYTTGGSFTITITATDNSGSTGQTTGSITATVPVGVPTVTVNSPTPNPAITGETVTLTFTVSSTDPVTGIMVNWGDGTTPDTLSGTATSDTHVYASTGASTSETFTITVTATNSAGPGSGTTTETVNDRPPVASFTFTPTSPSAGQTVSFFGSPSADPDGTVVSYAWDFGDGTTGTAVTSIHTYSPATTATFTVMLTVTDNSGSTGSTSQSITITVTAVNPPVVTITGVVPNPANTGQMVNLTFTVSSTATITGITVNWGDGSVSDSLPGTATSDTHNYANTGNAKSQTFTITVTATNSGGAGLSTTTETINDRPPVVTISTVTPNPANTGQTVTVSFAATDPDGTISSITVNWGDSSTPDTLGGTATSDTHSYTTAGNFTITATATDNSGSTGSASASERVTAVTSAPVKLTFQGFDLDDFDNGVGQLQVLVNGHLVVDIPAGLNHLSGTGDYLPYQNTWVSFGPFDVTSFVVQGQNTIVFISPPPGHFGLVKNVTITQGNTVLLRVAGTRFVSLSHPVTFTFSIPPLVITSFTVSDTTPTVEQDVTFTATYTGGTAPFTCIFNFGDNDSQVVPGSNGSCSVIHDYDDTGTFKATVRIIGASTSDRVSAKLTLSVQPDPPPLSLTPTCASISSRQND